MLEIPYATVVRKGRLQPGKMLLIDTQEQRIVEDAEVKANATRAQPFR